MDSCKILFVFHAKHSDDKRFKEEDDNNDDAYDNWNEPKGYLGLFFYLKSKKY